MKVSREMGARYMTFQELLNDERRAGIEEGKREGKREAELQTAYNFFKNGVSYELVRASIEVLTDEELQEIYENACKEL